MLPGFSLLTSAGQHGVPIRRGGPDFTSLCSQHTLRYKKVVALAVESYSQGKSTVSQFQSNLSGPHACDVPDPRLRFFRSLRDIGQLTDRSGHSESNSRFQGYGVVGKQAYRLLTDRRYALRVRWGRSGADPGLGGRKGAF